MMAPGESLIRDRINPILFPNGAARLRRQQGIRQLKPVCRQWAESGPGEGLRL